MKNELQFLHGRNALSVCTRKMAWKADKENEGRGYQRESRAQGIEQIADREPTAEYAAALVEEFQQRLVELDDQELREIAVSKMQGESNAGIADRRGCTPRTVERKLALIRKIWEE